jgi:hypothetical protein
MAVELRLARQRRREIDLFEHPVRAGESRGAREWLGRSMIVVEAPGWKRDEGAY